jgi:1,4-alpha-glucan branching enzyme
MNERAWDRKKIIPLAAAGVFILVMGTIMFLTGVPLPRVNEVSHLFQLDAPEAHSVVVVGDFNEWNPKANPLEKKNGTWQVAIRLRKANTYFYNFIIDGDNWITDPSQLLVSEDEFGKRSILELDAAGEVAE